ncbi:zinc transport system permease protein [Tangfeifania diversioriginum]|uniref:Zinc transport system permease protein n=1 Tax=Tangfeifania diversioriginum TaxID=1168035 RepID=A0A1M6HQP8_9BACT|nr:metal ABC transporter permease [Tangfeifania diversioriginum]SHJ24530.1 zinc transport system permease protein [Tangfeifania diversioriginum]
MSNLIELFAYDFFVKAFLAAVFASISCGIIGGYIVSRRIVFVSGGITHASFGGIGLAFLLGFNPLLGAVLFAVMSALGIQFFTKVAHVREDSSIAIWWSLGMALGIIFVFLTPGYTPNLMSYLFGNILTVTISELVWMFILNVVIILFFAFYFRKILYIAFDEEFARAAGLPVSLFNYLTITLIALTVVLNIRVVGIILILSLLTIPQATANLFTKDFRKMLVLSSVFAFIGTISGLFFSYYLDIPSGAAIIFTLVIIFALLRLYKHFFK